VNVHGFYYYVVEKPAPRALFAHPQNGILAWAAGDEIESCDHATFRSLGRTRIEQFSKRHAPETQGQDCADLEEQEPDHPAGPDLRRPFCSRIFRSRSGISITSLSQIGAGHRDPALYVSRLRPVSSSRRRTRSSKTVSSPIPRRTRLQAGSDIGFWSESGLCPRNLVLRNNRFTHSITGGQRADRRQRARLGSNLYRHVIFPKAQRAFKIIFRTANVTIEGNHIDDSYIYAIFVSNADGVKIIGNTIGQSFIRGHRIRRRPALWHQAQQRDLYRKVEETW